MIKSSNTAQTNKKKSIQQHYLQAFLLASGMLGVSLSLGILGYHFIAGFTWVDALLDASMILSGMGPVQILDTNAAKIFASCYALFSGVVFIAASGILLAPMFHRVLHRFHLEQKD
ncbi:MAG: hypothetical protein SH807_02395 [Blastochloris sp.]|jgi:hypothetical protein|nr:hypothetical protein [Blastochloris sp.]